ncbi:histone-lysine N-methyltransferase SETMAR [Trichonephila clavipes]|nr:histone-lysine N-methyltransferase SETMAR [Trichonephila clavipes]
MIVQFRKEKVSNHGSIPITIDCNVMAIVFEEGFPQPIKRTKQKGIYAVQDRKKFTDVCESTLTVRQCQNWFAKFRSGNFDVEDAPRSGKQVEADKDAKKALVDANR